MNRIHIVGRKNHGKTCLVVELVEELTACGWRVGTIKHTHHRHELDSPGKDSHRHRTAGAAIVGILARNMTALFLPNEHSIGRYADRYSELDAIFETCDVVIVEGDTEADAPKVEVWRADLGTEPLAKTDDSILAVVTDDPIDILTPVRSRSDIVDLANWIMSTVRESGASRVLCEVPKGRR